MILSWTSGVAGRTEREWHKRERKKKLPHRTVKEGQIEQTEKRVAEKEIKGKIQRREES